MPNLKKSDLTTDSAETRVKIVRKTTPIPMKKKKFRLYSPIANKRNMT